MVRTQGNMSAQAYWLLSGEALQRRMIREIREARTPLTARAPAPREAAAAAGPKSLTVAHGVATIRVEGVLTPTPDIMAEFYGEPNTTYSGLRDALADAQAAVASGDASEIVWSISSPGGSVDGYFALLDDIADARAAGAPMRVVADEAQSAAYGIAAAAGPITATSRTAAFGSVGVATSYFVQGGMCGEVFDLTNSSSPDKRPNLKTDEGRAVVVKHLDEFADEFMSVIAAGRGVSPADVAENFGRGASMLAKAAKAAGLIDAIASRVTAHARTLTNARTSDSVRPSMSEPITPTPIVAVEAALAPEAPAPVPAISAEQYAEYAKLVAERDARETAERRALVTNLVELGVETPATVTKTHVTGSTLSDLRERVEAIRASRPAAAAPAAVTPPASGAGTESDLEDFERREAAKIKDPEARARFVASRLARKQKAR